MVFYLFEILERSIYLAAHSKRANSTNVKKSRNLSTLPNKPKNVPLRVSA